MSILLCQATRRRKIEKVAGLFHVVKNIHASPALVPIDGSTMLCALDVGDALKRHALAVFSLMETDPDLENAKYILRWIQRKGLIEFSHRNCHHDLKDRFNKSELLKEPLKILEDRHFIRKARQDTSMGRPSLRYEVNPSLITEGA
ncbi:hypothetical protein WDW86_22265 [Bdellovibrionota bacterium FG-2]